jgi:hypothetical protein
VPFDAVAKGDGSLQFDRTLTTKSDDGDETGDEQHGHQILAGDDLGFMVEKKLRSLYESASQCGKEQIQVRLECKPTGDSSVINLFVFPFLSRRAMKREPGLKSKYEELLSIMAVSPQSAFSVYKDLIQDYQDKGQVDSTVICQVLVECDEVFFVKDLSTGATIQGYDDGKFRKVWHLIRMEMVVETHPANGFILPFEHRPGNWQITDIDDLLDGNLII